MITTRGGPCESDVERGVVRDAVTGKLIGDCRPADTTACELMRRLLEATCIRVELLTRDTAKWLKQINAAVAELYSLPRTMRPG